MSELNNIEDLARKAHKIYCQQYLINNGKEYWTKGRIYLGLDSTRQMWKT